jgi:DNA-binding transcriptional ArsR family regulator
MQTEVMSMDENKHIVELAQALSDPLRLTILQQLMEGPATVSELTSFTGESQSKVSNHLALLREQNLVSTTRDRRQVIYALRNASVGQLMESISLVSGAVPTSLRKSPQLVIARTCYDHLAGRYGVAFFDALLARQAISAPTELRGNIEPGPRGEDVFGKLGLDLKSLRRKRRRFAFACPDWTERRPHLGGALGAALWSQLVQRGWIAKQQGTRAIIVTDVGKQQFQEQFGIQVNEGDIQQLTYLS